MMKGAPEVVLNRCKTHRSGKDIQEIDDYYRAHCQVQPSLHLLNSLFLQKAWESLGNEGRRVIAFAQRHFNADMKTKFSAEEKNWPDDMVFLGMAAIMDPPRPETADAIAHRRPAGRKELRITGDTPRTAAK